MKWTITRSPTMSGAPTRPLGKVRRPRSSIIERCQSISPSGVKPWISPGPVSAKTLPVSGSTVGLPMA